MTHQVKQKYYLFRDFQIFFDLKYSLQQKEYLVNSIQDQNTKMLLLSNFILRALINNLNLIP